MLSPRIVPHRCLSWIAIFLLCCVFCQPVQALEKATVQLKWLHHYQFAGYYAALHKGFYRDAGLDVTIREGGPHVEVERLVKEGKADFGIGTSAIVLHRAHGDDLVVLAQIFQHSPAVFLTPRHTGIRSVADIAGRKVMYSNQHGDLLALLKKNGLDENSIVKVPHQGDPRDLLAGKAEVMIAYSFNEPFVLEQAGEAYLTFSPMPHGIDFYGDNLFTTRKMTESRPEFVKAFRAATLRGWQYALQNKEEVAALILEKYTPGKELAWLLFEANQLENLIQPQMIELGYQSAGRWQHISGVFASLGMLPPGYDASSIIYEPPHATDYRPFIAPFLVLSGISVGLTVIALKFRRLNRQLAGEISVRRQAELELQASEERLRTLINAMPDIVCFKDAEGRWQEANDYVLQLFECQGIEYRGKKNAELVDPSEFYLPSLLACEESDRIAWERREMIRLDEVIPCRNGSLKTFDIIKVPTFDPEGNRQGLVVVGRDITARKEAEEERLSLEKQLLHAQKLESLGVLAGGIAHDFNNILTSVVGNTELARLLLGNESPAEPYLARIDKAAQRATDLAKQMLAYSGRGKFVIEVINLNHLVEEMTHLLELSIGKKADLRLNLLPTLPLIEADGTQLRQVVMNLVINAAESMGEQHGLITVNTGSLSQAKAAAVTWYGTDSLDAASYVYFEVCDTGCGMDDVTRNRIFDPFFSTKFTGRGLGMAAVLGIVRSHRGAISIDSTPGQGSCFRIALPACQHAQLPATAAQPLDDWRGSGTVLLVDDEEAIRISGSEMLGTLGFTVITACNGEEALAIYCERKDIDLVILDLTMPGMNGDQAFRALTAHNADIKVIMSSGYSEQEINGKCFGKGLVGFIQKPYTLAALRQVVNSLDLASDL